MIKKIVILIRENSFNQNKNDNIRSIKNLLEKYDTDLSLC